MQLRCELFSLDIHVLRALEEQRITGMQLYFAGRLVNTFSTTGHSHENNIVVFLERRISDLLVNQARLEGYKSRAQLTITFHLA